MLVWNGRFESMHRLIDVHFDEDFCRAKDENVRHTLNIVRKIALNSIRLFKHKLSLRCPFSKIMFDCLLDETRVLDVSHSLQN